MSLSSLRALLFHICHCFFLSLPNSVQLHYTTLSLYEESRECFLWQTWREDRNFEKREFIIRLALGEAGAFPPRQLWRCVVSLRGRDTGRGRVSRQERENKTSKKGESRKRTTPHGEQGCEAQCLRPDTEPAVYGLEIAARCPQGNHEAILRHNAEIRVQGGIREGETNVILNDRTSFLEKG